LTSIEVHDIVCKIAEIVVVGGVRRSALISLSDLNDERMRDAKTGAWWEANAQRALTNNSAVYKERPEVGTFMKEWLSLYNSQVGRAWHLQS
jgi:ribonucleoside-diphosphate reductase alpha chain